MYYLDWLLDHQAEFQLLVMKVLGTQIAETIEWSGTRLLCIAADYNKFDEHAVQQINRNIELMRYRYFGDDLLLLELVNAQSASALAKNTASIMQFSQEHLAKPKLTVKTKNTNTSSDKTQEERLASASPELRALFDELCDYTEQLGDEVQRKDLKLYTAFKRIKNFASIVIMPSKNDPKLQLYLKLTGARAENNEFSRDVTNIGHWGTGDLEVNVRSVADLDKAKALINASYEGS